MTGRRSRREEIRWMVGTGERIDASLKTPHSVGADRDEGSGRDAADDDQRYAGRPAAEPAHRDAADQLDVPNRTRGIRPAFYSIKNSK